MFVIVFNFPLYLFKHTTTKIEALEVYKQFCSGCMHVL